MLRCVQGRHGPTPVLPWPSSFYVFSQRYLQRLKCFAGSRCICSRLRPENPVAHCGQVFFFHFIFLFFVLEIENGRRFLFPSLLKLLTQNIFSAVRETWQWLSSYWSRWVGSQVPQLPEASGLGNLTSGWVCWGGLWLALRIVLQGALIHKKDRNGDPPLVCAVLANNLEVIRLLVQVIIYYCCRYWFMLNWSASSFRFYTVCVVYNFPGIAFQFGICWICLDLCSRLDLCLVLFLFFSPGWISLNFCSRLDLFGFVFCFCSRLDLFGFLLQVGAHLPFTPSQLGERLTGAARWQLVRFPNPLAPRASESENLTTSGDAQQIEA